VSLSHIAVLDDETEVTTLLGIYLRSHGYRVSEVHNGAALLALIAQDPPVLVLLDLGLPGEDGLAIARQVRALEAGAGAATAALGLVIVTGRGDAVDKVVGLEIGADDYITKPFDLRELLARVKAVLRRVAPAPALPVALNNVATTAPAQPARERLQFDGLLLDLAARRLSGRDGNEIALTAGEFDLLCVLAKHPGRVLSRDFLLESTRGREAAPFDRTIDVQMGRLRKKLELDPQEPQLLKSVRGAGYMLTAAVVLA
jgi:two-component system, OmpR family, response regulator